MSRTLTISAASGRLFTMKYAEDALGHLLTVDFSTSNGTTLCTAACVARDGEVFTSDSRGNVTQFLIGQNRFSQHIRNVFPCSFICQTTPGILALVHDKELLVYNSNGKKITSFKNHYSKIRGLEVNFHKALVLTFSDDNTTIYNSSTWTVLRNMRAKHNSYTRVLFSPDGNSILNGFNDGKVYKWRLSDNKCELRFSFCDVIDFCISNDQQYLIGVNTKSELIVWEMKDTSRIHKVFEAIPGLSSIIKLRFQDSIVLILGNNGRLYGLDMVKSRIQAELQLGVNLITDFDVKGQLMTLITAKGTAVVYNVEKWIGSELQSREEKVRRGLEEDLAFGVIESYRPEGQEVFEEGESQISLAQSEDVVFTKLNRQVEMSKSRESFESRENSACQHELFKKLFGIAKIEPHSSKITHCKMKKILSVTGEYPEKYRALIWRFMLQLPNNVDSFAGLYSRGTHPALVAYFKKFNKQSQNEFSRTERITSALCYWSSLLSQVEYLHEIVNPFVLVFPGDDLSVFELIMSLILHWMQHWFEFFPSPPVVLLESISNIIKLHTPELHSHLSQACDLPSTIWQVLRTFLSKSVLRSDWLKLMDYLFTEWQTPESLLHLIAVYFITNEKLLTKLCNPEEISQFVSKPRKINIKKYTSKLNELSNNHGTPIVSFNLHLPVCLGQYPLFTAYPKYKVQTREELAEEILSDMKEKEDIRRYNVCLTEKIKSIEGKEKDFFQRAKSLGMCNEDIIELYHSEIVMKQSSLITFNNQ